MNKDDRIDIVIIIITFVVLGLLIYLCYVL